MMKAMASVEELSINYLSSFAIIQDVTRLDGCIYLPKLQVLQVTCKIGCGKNAVTILENATTVFSRLLEARGKGLSLESHDIVPLEKFVLWLKLSLQVKWPDKVLEVVHGWPSFAQVYVNGSVLERLTPSL